jgi:VanZ family protein
MTLETRPEYILRLTAPVLWALIILWLSLTPSPPQLPGVLGWDKLLHACAYGLLSLLLAQALLCWQSTQARAWWIAGLTAVAFGALLEILQMSVQTGRTAEWLDLFADAMGALVCCVIFRQMTKVSCRHHANLDKDNG